MFLIGAEVTIKQMWAKPTEILGLIFIAALDILQAAGSYSNKFPALFTAFS